MTVSPTFVAHFVDNEVVRMTTYCENDELHKTRGVHLARHAYRQCTGKKPADSSKRTSSAMAKLRHRAREWRHGGERRRRDPGKTTALNRTAAPPRHGSGRRSASYTSQTVQQE